MAEQSTVNAAPVATVTNSVKTTAPAANVNAAKVVAQQNVPTPIVATGDIQAVQEQNPAQDMPNQQPPMLGSTWMIVLVIGVWVLFLWTSRKNSKKQQQEREETQNSLVKGVRVVTIGRIHGVVVSTTDKTFTIRTDPNREGTLTFDREALLRIVKDGDNADEKKA